MSAEVSNGATHNWCFVEFYSKPESAGSLAHKRSAQEAGLLISDGIGMQAGLDDAVERVLGVPGSADVLMFGDLIETLVQQPVELCPDPILRGDNVA